MLSFCVQAFLLKDMPLVGGIAFGKHACTPRQVCAIESLRFRSILDVRDLKRTAWFVNDQLQVTVHLLEFAERLRCTLIEAGTR